MSNLTSGDVRTLMHFDAGKKSVGATYLLWLFLGGAGGHRFYTGRVLSGLAMFLLLLASIASGGAPLVILGLWALIDAFLIPGWVRNFNLNLADKLNAAKPPSAPSRLTPPPLPSARPSGAKRRGILGRSLSPLEWALGVAVLCIGIGIVGALRSSSEMPSAAQEAVTTASITPTKVAEPSQASRTAANPQPAWTTEVASVEAKPPPLPKFAPIRVPSDMKASYFAESVENAKGGVVRIVSRREGPSGKSYSHRECNCGKQTFRYIGDGESLAAMNARAPDPTFTKLVVGADGVGSVSYHVCDHACSAAKSKKASNRP